MKNIGNIILKSLLKASIAILILFIIWAFLNEPIPVIMSVLIFVVVFIYFVIESIIMLLLKKEDVKKLIRHFSPPVGIGLLLAVFLPLVQYIPTPLSDLEINIKPAFQSIGESPATRPDIKNILHLLEQPEIHQISHILLDYSPIHYFELILLIAIIIVSRITNLNLNVPFFFSMILAGIVTNILSTGWFGILLSSSGIIIPLIILILVSRFNLRMGAGGYFLTLSIGAITGLPFVLVTMIISNLFRKPGFPLFL